MTECMNCQEQPCVCHVKEKALYCRLKKVRTTVTVVTKVESKIGTPEQYLQILPLAGEHEKRVTMPYRAKVMDVSCDACGWFTKDLSKLKYLNENSRHWSVFDVETSLPDILDGRNRDVTWSGTELDYNYLRGIVKSPFRHTEQEIQDIRGFVKRHGYEVSDFDWFLDVSTSGLQLASAEIEMLLDFVDRMELKKDIITKRSENNDKNESK